MVKREEEGKRGRLRDTEKAAIEECQGMRERERGKRGKEREKREGRRSRRRGNGLSLLKAARNGFITLHQKAGGGRALGGALARVLLFPLCKTRSHINRIKDSRDNQSPITIFTVIVFP